MAPMTLPPVPPDEPIVAPLLASQLRNLRGKLRHAFGVRDRIEHVTSLCIHKQFAERRTRLCL